MSIFSSSSPAIQTSHPTRGSFALFGVLAGVCLFGATGCYAEVQAQPAYVTYSSSARVRPVVVQAEEDVIVDSQPLVEIEAYPTVIYAGRPCYWVDGRWYYRGPRGWVYYRSEPRGLVTHRVSFERRYPDGFRVQPRVNARVNVHVDGHAHGHGHGHAYGHDRDRDGRDDRVERRQIEVARPSVKVQGDVKAGASVKGGTKVVVKSNSKDRR